VLSRLQILPARPWAIARIMCELGVNRSGPQRLRVGEKSLREAIWRVIIIT